ncbi:PREDICTED: uncharacterized protein LOC109222633, partial [Nicotiana attenuata]|uniref:uncharacterized protein LOC109222633 n=1 Tax=Nicotiana attenuata TaxID=49451 RepID=UPI0009046CF3
GASRGNPGRSAIGVCCRDEAGEVKYAMEKEIAEGSNNEAEAVAILEALRICRDKNYSQVWLQTDSMLMKSIIEKAWKPPWTIVDLMEEIKELMEGCSIRISHIFREGNKLADHLANFALDYGNIECHDFWELDS